MADNSIVLRNITKRYGKSVAVDHLNLEIPANSFISLLGPSGCGKTTTLRMIAGLETPTEGEIWIGDRLVFSAEKGIDVPPNERSVGFLFQNYALWPHMTVYKNIAFGLENLKWGKKEIKEKGNTGNQIRQEGQTVHGRGQFRPPFPGNPISCQASHGACSKGTAQGKKKGIL
mgnify:CR=1 FL=1